MRVAFLLLALSGSVPLSQPWAPELLLGVRAYRSLSEHLGVWADADTGACQVSIRYAAGPAGTAELVEETVRYDVPISPRALAWVDASTLCVGGVEWSGGGPGATVIELWSFTSPRFVPASGGHRGRMEPGVRAAVRTIYRADAPGLRDVRELVPRGGSGPPAVLARFEDSKDLWSIELGELGRMRRQAGPMNSGAPVVAPMLARKGIRTSVQPSADGGVLYVLSVPSCIVSPDDAVGLLWDRDGDGVLDEYERLTVGAWEGRESPQGIRLHQK